MKKIISLLIISILIGLSNVSADNDNSHSERIKTWTVDEINDRKENINEKRENMKSNMKERRECLYKPNISNDCSTKRPRSCKKL